jgi:hypothetical protein
LARPQTARGIPHPGRLRSLRHIEAHPSRTDENCEVCGQPGNPELRRRVDQVIVGARALVSDSRIKPQAVHSDTQERMLLDGVDSGGPIFVSLSDLLLKHRPLGPYH